MDWLTIFPYTLTASILLLIIGIYGIISSKSFIRAVFSIEMLLISSNILLLSFQSINGIDSFAQTISIILIIISVIFAIVGFALEKQSKKQNIMN